MPRAPKPPKKEPVPPPRNNRHDRLLRLVERIEAIEAQKRVLAADLGDIKKEAKAAGFDVKTIAQMIRERRMEPEDRRTYQALCEIYRAALGMLDGTPLGDAARRRMLPPAPPSDDPENSRLDLPEGSADQDDPQSVAASPSADDVKAARAEGADAADAGKLVTANPYAADDVRRAAWDEGWCAASGSDGMEIPEAWRRKGKPAGAGKGNGA